MGTRLFRSSVPAAVGVDGGRKSWTSGHRLLAAIVAGLVVTTATWLMPVAAQAANPVPVPTVGIRLVDAPTDESADPRAHEYIIDHVPQGTTITRQVEIDNNTATKQAVQLYAAAGTISGGSFQFGAGRAANDLTGWTTVTPATVSPLPGGKSLATVTIAVPPNVSPGERYGVVWAQLPAAVPSGGGVATVNRVGIRMYLSVGEGATPPTTFAITALQARRDPAGNPFVTATVHNTGGRAIDLSGALNLGNGPGGLSAGPFAAQLGTTLGIGQTEPVQVGLNKAVPDGPWDATIVLRSGLTQEQANAQITFPAAAASSSGPVKTHLPASTGAPWFPILVALAVLAAALLVMFVLIRRRRREARP